MPALRLAVLEEVSTLLARAERTARGKDEEHPHIEHPAHSEYLAGLIASADVWVKALKEDVKETTLSPVLRSFHEDDDY